MQPFVRWEDLEFEANGLKYTDWKGKQLDTAYERASYCPALAQSSECPATNASSPRQGRESLLVVRLWGCDLN